MHLLDADLRSRVTEYFRSIGYAYVALDLDGFRSGSLNETLSSEQKNTFAEDDDIIPLQTI